MKRDAGLGNDGEIGIGWIVEEGECEEASSSRDQGRGSALSGFGRDEAAGEGRGGEGRRVRRFDGGIGVDIDIEEVRAVVEEALPERGEVERGIGEKKESDLGSAAMGEAEGGGGGGGGVGGEDGAAEESEVGGLVGGGDGGEGFGGEEAGREEEEEGNGEEEEEREEECGGGGGGGAGGSRWHHCNHYSDVTSPRKIGMHQIKAKKGNWVGGEEGFYLLYLDLNEFANGGLGLGLMP